MTRKPTCVWSGTGASARQRHHLERVLITDVPKNIQSEAPRLQKKETCLLGTKALGREAQQAVEVRRVVERGIISRGVAWFSQQASLAQRLEQMQ